MHKAQGSAIADEAIRRIAELYAVEKVARGLVVAAEKIEGRGMVYRIT